MAPDKDELGFIERQVLTRVEALLESKGLNEDVIRKYLNSGGRAINDVRVAVYGGTLANGTQTRGWITVEAALDDRLERIEVYLKKLTQQEWPGHAAAALQDEAPVPRDTSTDVDDAGEDQDATEAAA